ncbi:MAG: hypothetical protein ACJ75I_01260 [Solirubrobacterales bacterium]
MAAAFVVALFTATAARAAPPVNDNFADATPIQRLDDAAFSNFVTNVNFEATSEVGEPQHRDGTNTSVANNHSVWYSWTPGYTADATVFLCSFQPDQFHPLFGAYTGSSLAGLTTSGTNEPLDCDGNTVATDILHTFQAEGGTTYHFAVADTGGTDTFRLGVGQPPQNDQFANAELLTGASGQANGDNVSATTETGEPSHAGATNAQSIWYRWTAPMGGRATFNTCESEQEVDTVLAVYRGPFDSLTPVASNDNAAACFPQDSHSKVSFVATNGATYRIAVAAGTAPGAITLDYVDSKIPETTITGGPIGPTNDATPTFKFKSSVTGSTFRCRFDGHAFAPCSGPGATHTPASALTDGPHTFAVRAVNGEAIDPSPASRSFTVDTHPPQTTITAGPSGVTPDNTPTFKFASSETGGTFQCRIRVVGGSGSFGPCSGPGASHTPGLPLANGGYVFSVRAKDKAGNLDPSPANRSFTVSK